MHGWIGNILSINLTDRTSEYTVPTHETYSKYLGGSGLAGYFLHPHITEEYNSPDLPLIFTTGPLVDTPAPTSGRMCIMSRSPLTGTIGSTSVGGTLGTMIKRAGIDGIIITGSSPSWTGIALTDKEVTFVNAEAYCGMTTGEAHKRLSGAGSTVVIGPAAEEGIAFANIVVDGHFFSGRSGLGLIMAHKKLKFMTVRGSGKTTLFDRQEVLKAREEIYRLTAASPILQGELGIGNYGTGALYDLMHGRRMMPTANFTRTRFDHAPEMNAWSYKNKMETTKSGCRGCHIQCKQIARDKRPVPEFETMSHFSALLEIHNLEAVMQANAICNDLGMDTITAASTIACYAEIENIRLTPEQLISLLEDMGHSRGAGKELARGSSFYASQKGKDGTSMSVKGLELPAYDPRGAYGMGLAYATSTRGGCHLRAYPIAHEILRKPVATDRFGFSGKARIIKLNEDMNAVVDSLTACKFIFFAASLEEYARALYGATGMECSAQDLMTIGERVYYNERIMNARNGFSRKHDDLPERFFTQEGSSGDGIAIKPIDRRDFVRALDSYYIVRGLDSNGMPLESKAQELGLSWKS